MNILIMTGRVFQDSDIYTSTTGKQFVNLKISISKGKDKDGNWQSDIFTIQYWETIAQYINKYVHKGDVVSVEGRIGIKKEFDEHINKNRYTYFLTGTKITKLSNAQSKEYSHEDYQNVFKKAKENKSEEVSEDEIAKQMQVFANEVPISDSDIPF